MIKHKIMLKHSIYFYRFLLLKRLKIRLYKLLKNTPFKRFYRKINIAAKKNKQNFQKNTCKIKAIVV